MDAFDFADDPNDRKKKTTTRGLILNLGTLYFLASTFCVIGFFIYTYIAPNNPFNPFPPPTKISEGVTPTLTLRPSQTPITISTATASLLPTNTATATFTATFTNTPTVTIELTPDLTTTITATSEAPEITLTPTATSTGGMHFVPQIGTPAYASHPDGCNGIYLVGNVIDIEGMPMMGMIVDAGGSLGGATIDAEPSTSGNNPEFSPSGWQIKISDELIASNNSVYLAIYPADSDTAVSDLIFVETYDDCDHNMIMVNFTQDN
jgi:hypothetical protein